MLNKTPFEVPPSILRMAGRIAAIPMAVAGADAPVVMASVAAAVEAGIITPVLVGDTAKISQLAATANFDISQFQIIQASGDAAIAETAVSLVRQGHAAALMKGNIHTDALMRAVVDRDKGLRTGRRLSHIFHMSVPGSERIFYITDAAINIAPDEATMVHIINNGVELAHSLGVTEPKVALLSATEEPIAAMPSSILAANIVARIKTGGEVKNALVAGPFALDNAVAGEAAALKNINDPVAGNADILVVPNIETGNALFKSMVWFKGATAAGIVMGASAPIVLTSRADPPQARLTAAIIAAALTHGNTG